MRNEKIISIVVPVYNIEEYVGECLDSMVHQDLAPERYEVICINDGSTDGSAAVLDEYAKKYPQIKVYYKENGGLSSARNLGIEKSTGRYVWFVDGDDCIKENCLGFFAESVEKYNPDTILFNFRMGDKSLLDYDGFNPVKLVDKMECNTSVCFSIKRLSIIKEQELFFDCNLKCAEDSIYEVQYHAYSNLKELLIDNYLYYYRQRESSIMHTVQANRIVESFWVVLNSINELLKNETISAKNRELIEFQKNKYVWRLLWKLPQSSYDYKATRKELKEKGLVLPLFWMLPVPERELKWRIMEKASMLLSIPFTYWIYYQIARIKHKKK